MWADTRTKIRRFIRDPNANIWTNGFLLRSWNDAQIDFADATGLLDKVEALRVPPIYAISYIHEWEWNFKNTGGKDYKALKYHQQSRIVCCFKWETQILGITTGAETEEGTAFTQPWEAYMITNANAPTPVWLPDDFKQAYLVAWDDEPIEYITKKEITSTDQSWKTQSGIPFGYYREDILSNEIYLYPRPSSPSWDEIDGDVNESMVDFDDSETEDVDPGEIIDIVGYLSSQNDGIATDAVDTENNILVIYESQPTDIEEEDDEPDYPKFLQKYIEYAVIEKAYTANTDGRIESLSDYWKWRKELGVEFVKQYKWSRLKDRDFRLVSAPGSSTRHNMGPKLPDTYPDVR